MKISYEHDLAHNYVILQLTDKMGETVNAADTGYEIHMLEENRIPGFLNCMRKKINGKDRFYYEMTSRQSLAGICETQSLKVSDIRKIISSLYHSLLQMDQYLLDGNKIVLEPELVYLDVESTDAWFCYFPPYQKQLQDSFRLFASYLLYHLDQTDPNAVLMVYEMNRKVQEKNYALLQILREMEQAEVTCKEEPLKEKETENYRDERTKVRYTEQHSEALKEKREGIVSRKEKREKGRKTKRVQKEQTEWKKKTEFILFFVVIGLTGLAAKLEFLTITQAGGIAFLIVSGMAYGISLEKKHMHKKRKEGNESHIPWEMPQVIEKKEIAREEEPTNYPEEENQVGATTVLREGEKEYEPHMTLISMNTRERNSIVLLNDSYVIGKLKAKADIYISDEAISRIHAKIQKVGDEYYLCDMNSTNGTFLNGRRLEVNEKVPIHVADEIMFAGSGYYVGQS